jgi:hypothetical protein
MYPRHPYPVSILSALIRLSRYVVSLCDPLPLTSRKNVMTAVFRYRVGGRYVQTLGPTQTLICLVLQLWFCWGFIYTQAITGGNVGYPLYGYRPTDHVLGRVPGGRHSNLQHFKCAGVQTLDQSTYCAAFYGYVGVARYCNNYCMQWTGLIHLYLRWLYKRKYVFTRLYYITNS